MIISCKFCYPCRQVGTSLTQDNQDQDQTAKLKDDDTHDEEDGKETTEMCLLQTDLSF